MTAPHLSPAELKALVRTVPDFPHPGIQFRDITTLIGHHQGMAASVHHLAGLAQQLQQLPGLVRHATGWRGNRPD